MASKIGTRRKPPQSPGEPLAGDYNYFSPNLNVLDNVLHFGQRILSTGLPMPGNPHQIWEFGIANRGETHQIMSTGMPD